MGNNKKFWNRYSWLYWLLSSLSEAERDVKELIDYTGELVNKKTGI